MQITQKIIIIQLILQTILSKCLQKSSLNNFGWIPLEKPASLTKPLLCQKIYSKSRTCIEQTNFQEFLSNVHNILLKKKTKKYTELHDIIEELTKKFILLQKKLMFRFTFKGKAITKSARKSLDSVVPFLPKFSIDLRKQIFVNQKNCLNAQMKVIIGSFCVLSSEEASKNVNIDTPKKKVKTIKKFLTQDLGIGQTQNQFVYGMKVEEKASEKIIKACFPYVKGLCLFKKILSALDELENFSRVNKKQKLLCDEEILECKTISNCSVINKNNILQLIFGKKGKDDNINTEDINWVKRILNFSSWYEYLKDSFIYTKKKIKKNTHEVYDKVKYYLEILEQNTIDLFVEGEKGIDLVVEGENSGINIESSEFLSVVFGLCFIVLQLFF